MSIILLFSGALLAGAGGGFLVARGILMKWHAELERRPPVAIIDVTALAPPPVGMTIDAGQTARAIQDAARRLSAAGYVVLDAQAVLAAPDDRYVRLPEPSHDPAP
ncbi:MAG: hypothetical protein U1F76_14090 [Candidatus Competibacteraceae bacterium]